MSNFQWWIIMTTYLFYISEGKKDVFAMDAQIVKSLADTNVYDRSQANSQYFFNLLFSIILFALFCQTNKSSL